MEEHKFEAAELIDAIGELKGDVRVLVVRVDSVEDSHKWMLRLFVSSLVTLLIALLLAIVGVFLAV